MIRNYLITALRNMNRHRWYTGINVLGLAIGMAAALLIAVYVRGELAVDNWIPDAGRTYRLNVEMDGPQGEQLFAMSAPSMGPTIRETLPAVESNVRLCPAPDTVFQVGDRSFSRAYYFADRDVQQLFDLKLREGESGEALAVKDRVLLSETLARTWFGDEPARGKQIVMHDDLVLTVDGVFTDMPEASHLRSEMFVSIETITDPRIWGPGALDTWRSFNFYTYLVTRAGTDYETLTHEAEKLFQEHVPVRDDTVCHARLERMDRIYLHSRALYQSGKTGDIQSVRMFMLIAALVVLLAVINFINLSTARSSGRGLEVGIRKVSGSTQSALIGQFMGEAILQSVIAFIMSATMAELAMPLFRRLTGKSFSMSMLQDVPFLVSALLVAVGIGILAGAYPAMVLSGFKPSDVLKGQTDVGAGRGGLRRTLVVVQFSGAIVLLIATIVVGMQNRFMLDKDLGFKRENVVYLPLRSPEMKQHFERLETALTASPDVVAACPSSRIMGNVYSGWHLRPQGSDRNVQVTGLFLGYGFLETFGMKLAAGRSFERDRGTDEQEAFIINREAAEQLGLEQPVGALVEMPDTRSGTVIGVIENVHFQSLYRQPEPLMITFSPGPYHRNYLAVRVRPGTMPVFLSFAEDTWKRLYPGIPFDVLFQDEQLTRLYRSERRLGAMVSWFAGLSILIGCLGLLGLAAYLAERRSREISIRKVLGATPGGLVWLLSSEFGKLVLLANLVGWPVAFWVSRNWLDRFAYRIDIDWWIFPFAGLITLILACATVAAQALRAASVNPAIVLKGE